MHKVSQRGTLPIHHNIYRKESGGKDARFLDQISDVLAWSASWFSRSTTMKQAEEIYPVVTKLGRQQAGPGHGSEEINPTPTGNQTQSSSQ
jgi:hypothetical protein